MRWFNRHMLTVLILLAGCNTVAPAEPTRTPTTSPSAVFRAPTLEPSPTYTYTPTTPQPTVVVTRYVYPPTVTAPPTACEQTPRPTRLIIMERGIVIDDENAATDERVNVRDGPGTGNPVIDQLDIGDVFLVVDGPVCSPLYAWFEVQFADTRGWIAEGDTESYYVAPFMPG